MRRSGCVSSARSVVIWSSFVLALAGWGGAAWSWVDHGFAAGVNPGFIVALSVGITFTITCCQSIVLPDKAALYSAGHRDGWKAAVAHHSPEHTPDSRPLSVVR